MVHTRAINWLLLFWKCSLWHGNNHLLSARHSHVYHYWFGLFWESLTHMTRLISKPIWINFICKIPWNIGKCFPKSESLAFSSQRHYIELSIHLSRKQLVHFTQLWIESQSHGFQARSDEASMILFMDWKKTHLTLFSRKIALLFSTNIPYLI